jgi:hypothetical protein
MEIEFPARRALGQPFDQDAPPDFSPVVPVVAHRSTS